MEMTMTKPALELEMTNSHAAPIPKTAPPFTIEMAPAPTLDDLAREAFRELVARRTIYPQRIAKGEMSEADAARRLALQEGIYCRLQLWAEAEEMVNQLAILTNQLREVVR